MGLLDNVLSSLGQGGTGNALLDGILKMVNNPATGGLEGLIRSFHERGLGGIADSWVSTGGNLPISGDEIARALGTDRLGGLAQSVGLSHGDLSSTLASLLPDVVDKLTPGGRIPDAASAGDVLSQVRKLLG